MCRIACRGEWASAEVDIQLDGISTPNVEPDLFHRINGWWYYVPSTQACAGTDLPAELSWDCDVS